MRCSREGCPRSNCWSMSSRGSKRTRGSIGRPSGASLSSERPNDLQQGRKRGLQGRATGPLSSGIVGGRFRDEREPLKFSEEAQPVQQRIAGADCFLIWSAARVSPGGPITGRRVGCRRCTLGRCGSFTINAVSAKAGGGMRGASVLSGHPSKDTSYHHSNHRT